MSGTRRNIVLWDTQSNTNRGYMIFNFFCYSAFLNGEIHDKALSANWRHLIEHVDVAADADVIDAEIQVEVANVTVSQMICFRQWRDINA